MEVSYVLYEKDHLWNMVHSACLLQIYVSMCEDSAPACVLILIMLTLRCHLILLVLFLPLSL